jgi:hypothetical protein
MHGEHAVNLQSDASGEKRPYEKPLIRRVELAMDETLASGCKLGSDSSCVGPPFVAFEGGS